jgi:hypothetical protein
MADVRPFRVKLRNTQHEQMTSALAPTADLGLALAKALRGVGAFNPFFNPFLFR